MKFGPISIRRRDFLAGAGAAACSLCLVPSVFAGDGSLLTKRIGRHSERIPVIGMGTWITFNVGSDTELRAGRQEVLARFLNGGGTVIDSSPMYGSAQEVVGALLSELGATERVFAADKVWTRRTGRTRADTAAARELWGVGKMDLMQIHNLLGWEGHLENLFAMKEEGTIRYVGVTTSHGRRHSDIKRIMERFPLDFVQLTYSVTHRQVERELLPLAQERGIAVLANRPYDGGSLIRRVKRHPLPGFAREIGATTWAELLLKYLVSHPAVTCAIPATTNPRHMDENMRACRGRLMHDGLRARVRSHVESY